jgi:choline-sulfatase
VSWTAIGPALLRVHAPSGSLLLPARADHNLLHTDLHHTARLDHAADFNILLISVDALRGDYVPRRGEPTRPAPNLAKLATDSVNFYNAYSTGSRTAIAVSTLVTGRYSANIDWDLWVAASQEMFERRTLHSADFDALGPRIGYTTFPDFERVTTVAQRMQTAGLRTSATPYLAGKAKWVRRGIGFERGFDAYNEFQSRLKGRAPHKVVEMVIDQIDEAGDRRWFQWIHLFAPHRSHGKRKRYRTLVKQTDAAIGELIDALRERKLYERTVIIVTGDHGEGFGEHKARMHASSLYDEQVRVPLLVRVPGVESREYAFPTSSLDGIATILALADADLDEIDGLNLIPWLTEERTAPDRPVFTELHRYKNGRRSRDMKAVIYGDWKLICDRRKGTLELYDLAADPREAQNLIDGEPERFDELANILSAFWTFGERNHPLP